MATGERSTYREFRPPELLSGRLVCLWTRRVDGSGDDYLHPVLPDGCLDIVWINNDPPVVAGPATRRVLVALPAGAELIGVRFKPGWAADFIGMPAYQLLNQHVPLDDIWKRRDGRLTEPMSGNQPVPARLQRLSDALALRLASLRDSDPLVLAAVQWLVRHPAGRVTELARLIGVSSRQLHRRFRVAVGYGPKVFQRIMRFQRLLAVAPQHRNPATLAGNAGYADQAHMCREVREFADQSPQSLLWRAGTTLSMSDLFNTGGP